MLWNGTKFFPMAEHSLSPDKNDICVGLTALAFWYACWNCSLKKHTKLDLKKIKRGSKLVKIIACSAVYLP